MVIERFEDIKAWQEARSLTKAVYHLTRLPKFRTDHGLTSQIQRASVSVMANIAEGYDRGSRKEFANYLRIALGSATEVRSHLYVALDQDYISRQEFDAVYEQARNTTKLIVGFMHYLAKPVERLSASQRRTENGERRTVSPKAHTP